MADGPVIQTFDLENTLRALKNRSPEDVANQNVPYSPAYKPIPNQNYAPTTSVSTGFNRYAAATSNAGIVYGQPQFFSQSTHQLTGKFLQKE